MRSLHRLLPILAVLLVSANAAWAQPRYIEVKPLSLDFGQRVVGEDYPTALRVVASTQVYGLQVSAAIVAGPFAITSRECQQPVIVMCEIRLEFRPDVAGPVSGTLRITTTMPQRPPQVVDVPLKGVGLEGPPQYPVSITVVGDGKVREGVGMKLECPGTCKALYRAGTLVFSQNANAGSRFVEWSDPCGARPVCVLDVPPAVALTATFAVNPRASVSIPSVRFGEQTVGERSSTAVILSVTSVAQSTLMVSGAVLDNASDFVVVDGCANASLPAGASCDVSIFFAPSGPGTRKALLTISSDDPNALSWPIPLSGVGKGK